MTKKTLIGINGKIGAGKDTVGKIIQYLTNPFDRDMKTEFNLNEDYSAGNKWQIKKFADKLKDITCLILGCTREQLEDREFKEKELGEEWWYWYDKVVKKITCSYLEASYQRENHQWTLIKLTPRKLLQLLGTEAGRQIIHPNIWVNALFAEYKTAGEKLSFTSYSDRDIKEGFAEKPNWIITDMRFENELKAVKDRGGITIRVNRKTYYWISNIRGEFITHTPFVEPLKDENLTSSYKLGHLSETSLDDAEFDYIIDNNGSLIELIDKVKDILLTENIIQ